MTLARRRENYNAKPEYKRMMWNLIRHEAQNIIDKGGAHIRFKPMNEESRHRADREQIDNE